MLPTIHHEARFLRPGLNLLRPRSIDGSGFLRLELRCSGTLKQRPCVQAGVEWLKMAAARADQEVTAAGEECGESTGVEEASKHAPLTRNTTWGFRFVFVFARFWAEKETVVWAKFSCQSVCVQ